MESISNPLKLERKYFQARIYTDKAPIGLCRYLFDSVDTLKYCVERYARITHQTFRYEIFECKFVTNPSKEELYETLF